MTRSRRTRSQVARVPPGASWPTLGGLFSDEAQTLVRVVGRSRRAPNRVLAACLLAGAVCALLLEVGRGFLANDQASLARGALATLGAGFGVFLYGARINVVQILRGEPAVAPAVL